MTDLAGQRPPLFSTSPLCDLGLLIREAVDAFCITQEGYVRHIEADVPAHPVLVCGRAHDVAALLQAAIACVAERPGIHRRVVVRARWEMGRAELFVGHGNGFGAAPSLPLTLEDLPASPGAGEGVPPGGGAQRIVPLLEALGASFVLGHDPVLDIYALSIVFPGLSGKPLHRPAPAAFRESPVAP
ncbi:MAG: hypothetical protein QHC78_12290 [Pigmentiphaga sp.]|uniref:hypothetical protein n=1 Tax=Pigmentiphaga sp. TaxID=1977564 RepID=UPI0029B016BC|nr:hypothetical protein [Pigmentiphaga sp.]MDX3906459.1 hypothetical protein [Pigmentiphaga sp.]